MARHIKSVYVHAPVNKAHEAWQRFAGVQSNSREPRDPTPDHVQFIPAEGGCVVALVLDYKRFPGPLGRLFGPMSRLEDELHIFKHMVESAGSAEEKSVAGEAKLVSVSP